MAEGSAELRENHISYPETKFIAPLISLMKNGTSTPFDDLTQAFDGFQSICVSRVNTKFEGVEIFFVDYKNNRKYFHAPSLDHRGVFIGYHKKRQTWFYIRDAIPVCKTCIIHETNDFAKAILLKEKADEIKKTINEDQEYVSDMEKMLQNGYNENDEWDITRKYDGSLITVSIFFKGGMVYDVFLEENLGVHFPNSFISEDRRYIAVFCSRAKPYLANEFKNVKVDIEAYVKEHILDDEFPKTDFTLITEGCWRKMKAKRPTAVKKQFLVVATVTHQSDVADYCLRPVVNSEGYCGKVKTKDIFGNLNNRFVKFLKGEDGNQDSGEGYVIYHQDRTRPPIKVKYSSYIVVETKWHLLDELKRICGPIIAQRYELPKKYKKKFTNQTITRKL